MRETGILGTEPNTRLLAPTASSLSPGLPGVYHSHPPPQHVDKAQNF